MQSKHKVEVGRCTLVLAIILAIIIAQVPSRAIACLPICWDITEGTVQESGGCGCNWATGHCGDYYQSYQINYCDVADFFGKSVCSTPYVTVGYRWACDEGWDPLGVIECWILNSPVCFLVCTAAASACWVCPGCWACTQGAIDCYDCLTSDGIDCGCLVVYCEVGDVTHLIKANSATLSGDLCITM